ncbi:class II fructose-1,6-bisphosphate aldolase [Vallitalea sediminicola]
MLVNMNNMLQTAVKNNRIVPGFNVFGYEDAKVIIEVAQTIGAPVLLMTNRDAANFMPVKYYGALYRKMAEEANVDVCIHLDHGKNVVDIAKAIQAGYTSVMYDGSANPIEENIKKSKDIYSICSPCDVSLEVEVGCVSYSEPGLNVSEKLTEVKDILAMSSEVNVNCIAVAVGNVHRMTEQKAIIDFERLEKISKACPVPLVIHGSTGIPDDQIEKLRYHGVGKMNIGTAVRMAFGNTVRDFSNENPHIFDRIQLFQKPMEKMKKVVTEKYRLLGW